MIGFLAALTWERHARRQERRKLDEQAERQRLRAPEPGPEEMTHEELQSDTVGDWAVIALLMIPVTVLAILAVVISPWIFWIGLFVLCGLVIPYLVVTEQL